MYAICLIIVLLAGGIIGFTCRGSLDRRADGGDGKSSSGGSDDNSAAAAAAKRVESSVEAVQQSNTEAGDVLKKMEDLLATVRGSSGSSNPSK